LPDRQKRRPKAVSLTDYATLFKDRTPEFIETAFLIFFAA
jgi:hypothetical protein